MATIQGLAFVSLFACGDDWNARHQRGAPDAAGDETTDAGGAGDAALAGADVVVFDNADGLFVWDCAWSNPDLGESGPGRFLDLTQPAAAQPGDGGNTHIRCYKVYERGNETPGGIWFQSWRDPDAPGSGAYFAAGEPFVLEGLEDDWYDIDVTPPVALHVGDVIGPAANWVTGEPDQDGWPQGLQTAHMQDYSSATAESEIWFMTSFAGVRIAADDGMHYGFVELELQLDDVYVGRAAWNAVRWGYNMQPEQPLTIPP